MTNYKFMRVTRPRRFGKTMALSMLNAYYSKGCDSKKLFDGLKISKDPNYLTHLNKHNVFYIDMAGIYSALEDKNDFVKKIKNVIVNDFKIAYPDLDFTNFGCNEAFVLINALKNERFVFLIDEWDVIFREEPDSKMRDEYISFLRSLFKPGNVSQCFDLVYMTGILPIRRYSTQSALNMFEEYNMIDPQMISEYFGFTENEVKNLCQEHNIDFVTMKK